MSPLIEVADEAGGDLAAEASDEVGQREEVRMTRSPSTGKEGESLSLDGFGVAGGCVAKAKRDMEPASVHDRTFEALACAAFVRVDRQPVSPRTEEPLPRRLVAELIPSKSPRMPMLNTPAWSTSTQGR